MDRPGKIKPRWTNCCKRSIAEHVWLLEKTAAPKQFLVFGNEREVPLRWLDRYGALAHGVQLFFFNDDGQLEVLK